MQTELRVTLQLILLYLTYIQAIYIIVNNLSHNLQCKIIRLIRSATLNSYYEADYMSKYVLSRRNYLTTFENILVKTKNDFLVTNSQKPLHPNNYIAYFSNRFNLHILRNNRTITGYLTNPITPIPVVEFFNSLKYFNNFFSARNITPTFPLVRPDLVLIEYLQ